MILQFSNVQLICRCPGLINDCTTEAGYFQVLPGAQQLQHCAGWALTHSFVALYGSLQKESRVSLDSCAFHLLSVCGTVQTIRKFSVAVHRGCSLSWLCAMPIISTKWTQNLQVKIFLWQDNKKNLCSTQIICWSRQREGLEKKNL